MVRFFASSRGRVLSLLGVREMCEDSVVLRTEHAPGSQREYQAVLAVDPVNFPLLAREEQTGILERWRAFLAGRTPADRPLCIHMRVSEYGLAPYLAKLEETRAEHPRQVYREMAASHQQFLRQLAANQALLTREFYVRVSLLVNLRARPYQQLTAPEILEQARVDLRRAVADVSDGLGQAGLVSRRLTGDCLAHYYLSCVHQQFARDYGLPASVLAELDAPLQAHFSSAATPEPTPGRRRSHLQRLRAHLRPRARRQSDLPGAVSLAELLAPASVEERAHYVRIHHNTDEYLRGRAIVGYPAYAIPGWVDQLLAIDEPCVDVLMFFSTVDAGRFVQRLNRKLTGYRATQALDERQGRTENPYIAQARAEVEELRTALVARTEQVHPQAIYLLTRASSPQALRARDEKVAQVLKTLELQSVALEYEHLPAWRTCLDGRDILQRVRLMDTSTLTCSLPFCSANLSTERGALVGLTPGGGLLIIDPTSSQLENGNEIVFAKSGSGKSFYVKLKLIRDLLLGLSAIVVDPDQEFERICARFQGTRIVLSAGQLHINPFDLGRLRGAEHALAEKVESLVTLCDLLLAEKDPGILPQRERSYLRKMITRVYAAHGIGADPATHDRPVPAMRELCECMLGDGDPYELGSRLLSCAHAFPEVTDVDLENQLVVFNIRSLKLLGDESLLRIGLFLIADYVWTMVRQERVPRPRLLLIDEAWVLMEFHRGAQFLAALSRGARKYNLHVRMVTHNVEDFLASEAGRTIMLNSAMKVLMHQDATSLETVTRAFRLSPEERTFLETAPKGQGIFFCRASHVLIQVVASEEEYWLANTDPNQLLLEEQFRQQEEEDQHLAARQEAIAIEENRDEFRVMLPRVYDPSAAYTRGREEEER
jgi:hypothetical protein